MKKAEACYDRVIAATPQDWEVYRNRADLRSQTLTHNYVAETEAHLPRVERDPRSAFQLSLVHKSTRLDSTRLGQAYVDSTRPRTGHTRFFIDKEPGSEMALAYPTVLTQIWIALCMYLLLAFLKFQSKLMKSMQQILRLLQLNLFEKRDLMALLRGDPSPDRVADPNQIVML